MSQSLVEVYNGVCCKLLGLTFKKNLCKSFPKSNFLLVVVKVFAVGTICKICVSSFHQGQDSKVWIET